MQSESSSWRSLLARTGLQSTFPPTYLGEQIDAPLRSQVLAHEPLLAQAREEALNHQSCTTGAGGILSRPHLLRRRLGENLAVLRSAYNTFSIAAENNETLPGAAIWLLDNYHIIVQQAQEVRRHLPQRYFRSLPRLLSGPAADMPRIYLVATEFVRHTDATADKQALIDYVSAYQQETVLTIGELWAMPIMLRLALIENLRRLAVRTAATRISRRAVDALCEKTIDVPDQVGSTMVMRLAEAIEKSPTILNHGAAAILRRVRQKGSRGALALQWVLEKLKERGIDADAIVRQEQQEQANNQLSFGNSISSLRAIDAIDWHRWFEAVSRVHGTLAQDPASEYLKSDFETRDQCRQRIEQIARRAGLPEILVAERCLALAEQGAGGQRQSIPNGCNEMVGHVGFYLLESLGRRELIRACGLEHSLREKFVTALEHRRVELYVATITALALAVVFGAAICLPPLGFGLIGSFVALLLLGLIASDLAIRVTQFFIPWIIAPRRVPRRDYDLGIPESDRTAVVVHTIAHDLDHLAATVRGLEVKYLANRDPQLLFGILADVPDATDNAHQPGDKLAIEAATAAVQELNARYSQEPGIRDRFFVMFRARRWNESEGLFMCWERKRGKLVEFNRYISGATDTSFHANLVDQATLRSVRFVITLDNDAELTPGTARQLVGTASHLLNRPWVDPETRTVKRGYAVIQPRVGITLRSATASVFSGLFAGRKGVDPYTTLVSDTYQDLFANASYIGKGIYHVHAFEEVVSERAPENSILSHDLFEGFFARVALASDIELYDTFPRRFLTFTKRQHRWIRGDWQLLPWLLEERAPLDFFARFRIADNLRRSLIEPATVLLLLLVAIGAPLSAAVTWACAAIGLFLCPAALQLLFLVRRPSWAARGAHAAGVITGASLEVVRTGLWVLFLLHTSISALHAITVTLYRLFVSHRRLLEWESALVSELRASDSLIVVIRSFLPSCAALALLNGFFLWHSTTPHYLLWTLSLVWAVAPFVAWSTGQVEQGRMALLGGRDKRTLADIAYRTWRYFDSYLVPEYHYLIPDNLQLVPKRIVAERTSPTNVSLGMLAVVAAHDLSFISLPEAVERITGTTTALGMLERHRGHLLNWYDIRSLRPLPPRYVSSVDSGNFIAHLVTIKQALLEFQHRPFLGPKFIDHLTQLRAQGNAARDRNKTWTTLQPDLSLGGLYRLLNAPEVINPETQGCMDPEVVRAARTVRSLAPYISWIKHLPLLATLNNAGALQLRLHRIERILELRSPSPFILQRVTNRILSRLQAANTSKIPDAERAAFAECCADVAAAHQAVETLVRGALVQAQALSTIIDEVDFKFLYDSERELLVIGYDLDAGRKGPGCYDLLASEARLASFIAIVKGDIPARHWFRLGRTLTPAPGGWALRSWSGTMFEYLMPTLVAEELPSTLLGQTHQAVVATQISYADRYGVPWGISESSFSGVDFEKTYQYRAFGVPSLGVKRGLADDLVISPYSTILALGVAPEVAIENIERLKAAELYGEFGFYESIDYTPDRLGDDEKAHTVRSFFAHHQGMSLVALTNALTDGIFRRRFHRDAGVAAFELLFQEQFPTVVPASGHRPAEHHFRPEQPGDGSERTLLLTTPHTDVPRIRILSNGQYSVFIDNAGSGASFVNQDFSLTRWQDDPLRNNSGSYFYIRDLKTMESWSTTYQPMRIEPDLYEVFFHPEKTEFIYRYKDILVRTEIVISPEDPVEVRKLTLTNLGSTARSLDVTSFNEVVLAQTNADLAHPAFQKLFVESEIHRDLDALVFSRRPRDPHDKRLFFAHMLTTPVVWDRLQFETARVNFLGRGRGVGRPKAMEETKLSEEQGTVLDPIATIRTKVELEPDATTELYFCNVYAENRVECMARLAKFKELSTISRVFELAWSHSDVEIRNDQFSLKQLNSFHDLANALIYPLPAFRAPPEILEKNRLGQSGLWRFGISGDEMIVVVLVNDPEQTSVVHEVLLAHEFLRRRGIKFDLVILNEFASGYLQELQGELEFMVRNSVNGALIEKRGGVYLRGAQQLSDDERALLLSYARMIIKGESGTLGQQLLLPREASEPPPERRPIGLTARQTMSRPSERLEFPNGIGGFGGDGSEYVMYLDEDNLPPQPWSNVVAQPNYGFLITEAGGGYTWAGNSRENRITPWSNDPVRDPAGEVVYARDMQSGEFWSLTPRPRSLGGHFRVVHTFGKTTFESQILGLHHELTVHGAKQDKVKWYHVKIQNTSDSKRLIELFFYVEWVLGVMRTQTGQHLRTGFDPGAQCLFAENPTNPDYPQNLAFIGSTDPLASYTGDRKEFIGRHGDVGNPASLARARSPSILAQYLKGDKIGGIQYGRRLGAGRDSAGVLKVQLVLEPGAVSEVGFYLAVAESAQQMREDAKRYQSPKYRQTAAEEVLAEWHDRTTRIRSRTPNRALDIMMNGWLLYQTWSCRLVARTGFYQSSGAIGFRDQLQDSLALLTTAPAVTLQQILLHASRQFEPGDVQHWWHPPSGRGIRTRISDNYMWLPFAVAEYLQITGNTAALQEMVPFIEGPVLEANQKDSYHVPSVSRQTASLYEHCARALDRFTGRLGCHDIPLIEAGDWNDGFDHIGHEGKGESIWLGWFGADILVRFAQIAEAEGQSTRAELYRNTAATIVAGIEKSAWDGSWYMRAFFDSGAPLGSHLNTECSIDAIAQSWSIISGQGKIERQQQALESLAKRLIRDDSRVVLLLDPAFDKSDPNPGYIQGYPPGIRENGGQYTHASTWSVLAAAKLGNAEYAHRWMQYLNPISHGDSPAMVQQYRCEPYVLCGDVYSVGDLAGRGGWSWYTGSSGWLFRVGTEHLLGLKVRGASFTVQPVIPADWREFSIDYRPKNVTYRIRVLNPHQKTGGPTSVSVGGKPVAGGWVDTSTLEGSANVVDITVTLLG